MTSANTLEAYMTIGALGISFLTLIGIIMAWIKSIDPTLNGLKKTITELKHETSSTLENNTKAIETVAFSLEEVARSNENVAGMVHLLNNTLESQAKLIESHDKDAAERFANAINHLKDYNQDLLKAIDKNSDINDKQHREIIDQLIRHDDRGQRIEFEAGKIKGHVEQVKILISKKE